MPELSARHLIVMRFAHRRFVGARFDARRKEQLEAVAAAALAA